MKKAIFGGFGALLLFVGGMFMVSPAVVGALVNSQSAQAGGEMTPAVESIPPAVLGMYAAGAATCAGLSWTILAAIGTIESGNGTSDRPGVHSGHNSAGAEGPMQFEPATFAAFDEPVPPGGADPPSPYDQVDAVFAAARMLCADGAGRPDGLGAAIYDYNHSEAYVAQVLSLAQSYGFVPGPGGPAAVALLYALAQVGTPYRWGGESPGIGFDCSGLAQAAWAAAGVALARVAEAQFDAGPPVPAADPLVPGDLVFFGSQPGDVTHVGIVVDPTGVMVDAPHTGANVRIEPFPTAIGGRWGGDIYLGATNPGWRRE